MKAIFSQAENGAMAEGDAQGTIGLDVLKQFTVIIDYPDRKIALLAKH